MTTTRPGSRVLGSMRVNNGKGTVRMEDVYDTAVADMGVAAYGAGWRAHMEDVASHLAGREGRPLGRAHPALPHARARTPLSVPTEGDTPDDPSDRRTSRSRSGREHPGTVTGGRDLDERLAAVGVAPGTSPRGLAGP